MATANPFTFQTQYCDRETDKLYCKNRYYDPNPGRWLSQDPNGELGWSEVSGLYESEDEAADEPYLYAFVGNDGISSFDPFGLWKINRNGAAKAAAVAEQGDTVDELAEFIGLDADAYGQWLTPLAGTDLPYHSSYHLTCGGSFEIPNTMVAYWAGAGISSGRDAAKDWVQWNPSLAYLSALGFYVDAHDHVVGDEWALRRVLASHSNARELHGLYFWGEGLIDPTTKLYWGLAARPKRPSDGRRDRLLDYSDTGLTYQMAIGLAFACGSNSGESALMSASPGRIWNGFTGLLVPHPFHRFDVSHFVHPGDQGTKPTLDTHPTYRPPKGGN